MDDAVSDDEKLYRRIPGREECVKRIGDDIKISASAFNDAKKQPSVDRARLCDNNPRHKRLSNSDGVISLIAGDIRSIGTIHSRDEKGRPISQHSVDVKPDPKPKNAAHAIVFTDPQITSGSAFRKLKEALAILANNKIRWEIPFSG